MEAIHPNTIISRIQVLCSNRGISKGVRNVLNSQILPLHLTCGTEDQSSAISIACRIGEWAGIEIWKEVPDREVKFRCRAFQCEGTREHRFRVSMSGCVRVWDDIAGYYTMNHSVSERDQQKIRKLAWKK